MDMGSMVATSTIVFSVSAFAVTSWGVVRLLASRPRSVPDAQMVLYRRFAAGEIDKGEYRAAVAKLTVGGSTASRDGLRIRSAPTVLDHRENGRVR